MSASAATSAALPEEPRLHDRPFIGGEWGPARSGRLIRSIDPSTEDVWAEVAEAGAEDVDAAVQAARQALRGPWGSFTPTRRGELIGNSPAWCATTRAGLPKTKAATIAGRCATRSAKCSAPPTG